MPISSTIRRKAQADHDPCSADFFFEEIFKDARLKSASEIRLVPAPPRPAAGSARLAATVQFLIAGVLHDIIRYPDEAHEEVVARLKVLAGFQEDARLVAQAGALRLAIGGKVVKTDVSIVPMVEGEKVILQLAARASARRRLAAV